MNPDTLQLAKELMLNTGIAKKIDAETLDALLASATSRTYSKNHIICLRGELLTELHFILSGTVELSIEDSDGRRAICWYLGPGQWYGITPVIDGGGSVHNLRAHSETLALCVPRQAIHSALAKDARLSMLFLQVLGERARNLSDNLAAATLLPLRGRIARVLLLMVDQHGQAVAHGQEIGLKVSQDELAAMLGVSRQSVNRELRALEAEGILTLAYSRIRVCNAAALLAAATSTF